MDKQASVDFQQHFSRKDTSFLNVFISAKQMRVKEMIPNRCRSKEAFFHSGV